MLLVVDTNILFSFFRENPVRFVIVNAKLFGLELLTSKYNISELKDNKAGLLKYSKLNLEQVESVIDELDKFISGIASEEYKEFESEAKQLAPHDKDIPFFALALKLGCAIWSNEPAFKEQSRVKVFNTRELLELVGLSM